MGGTAPITATVGAKRQMSRESSSNEHWDSTRRRETSLSDSHSNTIQEHPFRNPKLSPLPPPEEKRREAGPPAGSSVEGGQHRPVVDDSDLPPPAHSRRPPSHPVLLPEYRYCYKDNLVKPMRTHHCRICGTVSYDFVFCQ